MNRREMIVRSSAAAVGFGLRGWLRVAAQETPQTKPVPFETAPLVGHKLNPRSGPPGKTMFTLLPPEATGVRTENQYADPQMKGALFQQYNGGSIGTGVAIGDFDNDGRPDIFVVSKTESCRLFRNLGNFKFEDVTDKAGVGDKGEHGLSVPPGKTMFTLLPPEATGVRTENQYADPQMKGGSRVN